MKIKKIKNGFHILKEKDSVYQKHSILAWSITIVAIVVGLFILYNAFNSGYKSVYQR